MGHCPICAKDFSAQEYGGRFQANSQLRSHILMSHPRYQRFMAMWGLLWGLPIFGSLTGLGILSRFFVFGIVLLIISTVTIPLVVLFRSRRISTYKLEWAKGSVASPSVEPSQPTLGQVATDENILQATSSLSQLLNIPPVSPARIRWIDYIAMGEGGATRVEADKPMVGGKLITLPLRFRDQLTTAEWRPLISSMLITRAWQRTKILSSILLVAAVAVGANAAVYFLLSQLLSAEPIIVLLITLVSFIVVGVGLGPLLKKELLEADKQTAASPGTNNLLQVLQKLEASGEDQSRPRMSPYGKPTIRQRIENLQSSSRTKV